MLNPIFSFEECGSDVNYNPLGFINESSLKPAPVFSAEDMGSGGGAADDLWASYGFYITSPLEKAAPFNILDNPQFCLNPMATDGANFHAISNATQKSGAATLNYRPIYNCFDGERESSFYDREVATTERSGNDQLSTEEVMRIAAAHFIQLSSPKDGDPSTERFPFGITLSSLTAEEIKNVELASLLLAAAEKVANQQYERASNLLRQCYTMSSSTGNPVQRVVHYFSDALQERIDRETRRLSAQKARGTMTAEEMIKAMRASHPLQLICYKTLPFVQIIQFTSMQAIIDNVAEAKRIHVIGLSIRHGLEWTILIQALATRPTCPVESLKMSAVGLAEDAVAETGKRLSSFAEGFSLQFEFRAVVVPDMKDLRETMFELSEGEVLVVHSDTDMNTMIARPETLENVMRVIWKLRPSVTTVVDVEAKHNSPSFIERFTEALFYFNALFDCMDSVMRRDDGNRMALEGTFFSQGINCMVAAEGEERVVRHVGVSVWREFFARFGLVEADLNEYSSYQASLILEQFAYGDSCTLEMNGKSLLIGWKGTPLYFVSAWKFHRREAKT